MNWREVLAMPPAMRRVVPVTAALMPRIVFPSRAASAIVGVGDDFRYVQMCAKLAMSF